MALATNLAVLARGDKTGLCRWHVDDGGLDTAAAYALLFLRFFHPIYEILLYEREYACHTRHQVLSFRRTSSAPSRS